MDKNYKVKVNDSQEFEFDHQQIASVDTQKVSENQFHILKNNRSFKAEVLERDFNGKNYTIKINGNTYKVDIANELDLLIESMGLTLASAQKINDIKAPMPGLILDVNVEEGSEVKEGDYLLVLEAMKMENTITAPRDGVVKKVSVVKGDAVEKNQLLIEME